MAASVLDGAGFKPEQLAQVKQLIIITSTYGDGEPPDNITELYRHLHSDTASSLTHMGYCVLALGDSSYATFCKAGRDFDARLAILGARRLTGLVTCDIDFEAAYQAWISPVVRALQPTVAPAAEAKRGAASPVIALCDDCSTLASVNFETKDACGYSRTRPFPARIVRNANLHANATDEAPGAVDSEHKQTRHVAFSLRDSGLRYEPGDALGVMPSNPQIGRAHV